jgi:hypothetical protein
MKALLLTGAILLAFPAQAAAQQASIGVSGSVIAPVGVTELRGVPTASAHVGDTRAVVQTPTYALAGGQVVSVQTANSLVMRQAGGASLTSDIGPARLSGASSEAQSLKLAASVPLSRHASPGLYTGALSVVVDYN